MAAWNLVGLLDLSWGFYYIRLVKLEKIAVDQNARLLGYRSGLGRGGALLRIAWHGLQMSRRNEWLHTGRGLYSR